MVEGESNTILSMENSSETDLKKKPIAQVQNNGTNS